MKLNVLYEDNHLIAVEKPAGVLVQGDRTGDISLIEELKNYLKIKYKKVGSAFVGLLHRLDRPTSGIVLFAKTSKGASRLSDQFRNHEIKKTYHCVVIGKPRKNKETLINYLKKDRKKNRVSLNKTFKRGFQRAELFYEIVDSNNKYSLLKVNLKTGRPHQIRVQLSNIGCPIVGDVKYKAKKPLGNKSILLCATDLIFKTATQERLQKISILIPQKWKNMLK